MIEPDDARVECCSNQMNVLVAPCVSPSGYEVINRRNPNCVDPNRAFAVDIPSEESAAAMKVGRRPWSRLPHAHRPSRDNRQRRDGVPTRSRRGVEQVTQIAPPDDAGQIIGSDAAQHGVINYPCNELGLCARITDARFTMTTEVFPDSAKATPEICNEAQVAAVRAGLDFALSNA